MHWLATVAKRLHVNPRDSSLDDSPVRFLGSFNLPPQIKSRMRQLHWNCCLLYLAQFLGLLTEDEVEIMEQQPGFAIMPRDEALTRVICAAKHSRMEELGLRDSALARWVNVAYGLRSMAVDYEPSGKVHSINIFHAVPLKQVVASREEWISEHLCQWRYFSRTEPRFYAVGGAYYTMLGPEHVAEFAGKLKAVMKLRGV
ncbi:NRPS-like enzyme [Corynespora cassiicola Philippines]|uniref:NRPS-like enzyme n=1 Tax=Corynespora cassiicola Philippines TaxID=1448308 RepID=A0A2T2N5J6_CORCC|nr:NRPS-like enzyme [Corynespora cassiicola Philippines]